MTDVRSGLTGTVGSIWRYPVKSMQGEEIDGALVTRRGVPGDRAYALVDRATGHVVSAKHPRKWAKVIECRASFAEEPRPDSPPPPVHITLPDGAVVSSDEPEVDRVLSRALGREVALVWEAPARPTREANRAPVDAPPGTEAIREEPLALAAPAGTFFDHAPVHLLTSATLARLRELSPSGDFDLRRFRPNFFIEIPDGDERGFVENGWPGQPLAIGVELRLRAIDPTPRCVVTTLAQGDLPHDAGILRTVARHSAAASATIAPGAVLPAVAGVYATVLRDGLVRRGDAVRIG